MDWVVIVDDDADNRGRVSAILNKIGIRVTELSSGDELIHYIEGMFPLPDLILLDVIMPGMDGLDTLKALRNKTGFETDPPVIFLTGNDDLETETEGLKLGAVDFIRKPFFPEILTLRVRRTIEYVRLQKNLSKEVERKTKENNRLTLHVVQTLAEAIDAKDKYTKGHSGRVATYSREIASRLGYDEEHLDEIYMMGLLHDVGKIGVPDWIINKTERLTDKEFGMIKTHPEVGNRILSNIKEMPQLAYGARWHHERVDGRGYPDGIKGSEIPEEARIIAVADAYDAMTSNRSYRDAMTQEAVKEQIVNGKDSQFDAHIADIMIAMIDEDTEFTMREGEAEKAGLRERASEETIRHLESASTLPQEIVALKQLDTDLGIHLCGDIEDYIDALSVFSDSCLSKSDKIENCLASDDIQMYTTLVHSLKSSARTIGATEISEMARKLETEGKNGDIDGIRKDSPRLVSAYRELGEILRTILIDN